VKVAVVPVYETVPAIGPAPCTIKEAWVIVAGFMASLKVTVIIWLSETPVASFAGVVDITIGHTPGTSTKVSFLHAANRNTDTIARVANSCIFFNFSILL
jgi:hypothetical protein